MAPLLARLLFAGTIFTSAALLFLVQPLIAKQILPWFGGSAAVWSICMVFFQVLLLAGYAYADWVARHLAPRAQARLHGALLAVSLAFLPIVAGARWKPDGTEDPTLWILGLLAATIGLPYFLLSTTGPLVQSWVARSLADARVYRYFSLSNLASLLALVAYPFVIEPHARLVVQAQAWSVVYGLFALLCASCAWYAARHAPRAAHPAAATPARAAAPPPPAAEQGVWLALSALGSWLLLAVTNHITQNVASIPFLWLLPLTIYLFTFVLCFESDRWYRRRWWLAPAAALLLLCGYGLQDSGVGLNIRVAIPVYAVGLFVLCMFLHGELAQRRPGPEHLTRFYLMLSLGGAVGGILVGLVAPRVLPAYYELGIGLVLTALLAARVLAPRPWLAGGALACALACAVFLWLQVDDDVAGTRRMARNFYGTLLTTDVAREHPRDSVRQLYHGSVKHGEQYLAAERRREPTTYYGPASGIGLALAQARLRAPGQGLHIGLVGLGAGVLAAYGHSGDRLRFYEINPTVLAFAQDEFSFMRDSPARIDTVLGDARLALEREPPQGFHVLAVDAFSGDSVPVHLITLEALRTYLRHLAPDGIVAFHLTNRFLWMPPVVQRLAQELGAASLLVHDAAETSDYRATDWVLVARDPAVLQAPALRAAAAPVRPPPGGVSLWSDDFNNLFEVLR